MKLEEDLWKEIRNYFTSKGGKVTKYHGSKFSELGVSDLIICYRGVHVVIETKSGYNKPKGDQSLYLQEVKDAGGIAVALNWNNYEECIDLIVEGINEFTKGNNFTRIIQDSVELSARSNWLPTKRK